MPVRHRFYDPIIQTESPPEPVRCTCTDTKPAGATACLVGIENAGCPWFPEPAEVVPLQGVVVHAPGVYLLTTDVASALIAMSYDFDGDARDALLAAAQSFAGATVDAPAADTPGDPAAPVQAAPAPILEAVPQPPPHPDVARIEVFPNEDASYWYARAVNTNGDIIFPDQIVSGINRDLVESVAVGRWPGAPVYALTDGMGDSIWDEQTHAFGFNGRRRPSPRRVWA